VDLSSSTDSSTAPPTSFVDAAVAWTDDPRDPDAPVSPVAHGYELEPDPIIDSSLGEDQGPLMQMSVMKDGRTTELTFGTITGVHHDVVVGYGEPEGGPPFAHFANGLMIVGQGGATFSKPGDSGSLIVEASSRRPVALLVAGDGRFTYANPIGDVIDGLHITRFLNSRNLDP
jgi:hypothetical protein